MKAFLHIGTEKTGTTTIQNFLNKNRKPLLDDGYLYPISPGKKNHTKLAIMAIKNTKIQDIHHLFKLTEPKQILDFQGKFKQSLEKELSLANVQTIILSSEHCSSRLIEKEEIEDLKLFLDTFFEEVKIIIYLRRQDQFLASSYSTAVRCGRSQSFNFPSNEYRQNRYNYYYILKKWEAVFGKNQIIIKIFEPTQMVEGNLLKDFTKTVGIKLDHRYQIIPNANQSLDIYSLEYLRRVNLCLKAFCNNEINQNKYRQKIVKYLEIYSKKYTNRDSLMSQQTAQNFMSLFYDSNKQVVEYFFKDSELDGELFSQDFTQLRIQEISKIALLKQLLKITAFLLKSKIFG